MSQLPSQKAVIHNDLGMHLRAAGTLVQMASKYEATIWIQFRGVKANAKSIMSVLALAAHRGAELLISAEGKDAEGAVAALAELVENGFEAP